ncbi:MAG: TPM domain-containing protein [Bacteroidia bacterium]|nr:TPM domain-containing protein [Bacteroidia bacterium]
MRILTYVILSILLFNCQLANAGDIPSRPHPARLVNDMAGILDNRTTQLLENALVAFDDSTSTQICVVTLKDLHGYSPSEMAYEIGEKWKVGQKGKNNGIVLLVKPKVGSDRGRAFIATGYGLEGALPDAICTRIVNETMVPYFRNNDYKRGIIAGVQEIMKRVTGEYTRENGDIEDPLTLAGFIIMFILVVVIILIADKTNHNNRNSRHITHSSDAAWILGSMLNSASRHSSWGGGSYRGGSFGGFGGGSFGGGGGGGSW